MHLGLGEMVIVLVVALLVFGPNKLPQLGDALGKSLRDFKHALDGPEEGTRAASLPQASQGPVADAESQTIDRTSSAAQQGEGA